MADRSQRFQEPPPESPYDNSPESLRRAQIKEARNRIIYRTKGAMVGLEKKIYQFQDELDARPDDHPDQAQQVYNLGTAYGNRYRRTGAITDLEAAIQRFQEALDATPDGPSNRLKTFRSQILYSLGAGYHDRYRIRKEAPDLEMAIQRFHEALKRISTHHPRHATALHSLGAAYHDKYRRTQSVGDIEIAIQCFQSALEATPDDGSKQARRLCSLGTAYRDRSDDKADRGKAIRRLQEALDHSSSPIVDRLRPCKALLALYVETKNWPLAYQAASTAVSLIPQLAPHSLENPDKQHYLIEFGGLASDAAAVSLLAGETVYAAIRLLELGRGVMVSSSNHLRSFIPSILQKDSRLQELDSQLQTLDPSTMKLYVDSYLKRPQDAEAEIDSPGPHIPEAQELPSEDELKIAAACGPIVIINVSVYRCDAFLIEKTGLRKLRLPRLHSKDIWARTAEVPADSEILEWLWETVSSPVLDALGFTQAPLDGCWPHVWWIPTGPLTKFPLHAAGLHVNNSTDTVLDRVISSYSSSLRAHFHSYQARAKARIGLPFGNAVLVGMQKTPGQSDLEFAMKEIDRVEDICDSMQLDIKSPRPYQEYVKAALKDCKIFHFAGHGLTDPLDPSKSGLLLCDKPLTVSTLFEEYLHGQRPFLAYLSACGTGQVNHDGLLDEGMHLIGACQLAGFQHVIGALWKVEDKSCVDVASMIYEWIKKQHMSNESVSEGLHHAIRDLRGKWICENTARTAFRGNTKVQNEAYDQVPMGQPPSSQVQTSNPRNVMGCEGAPLYWVPYVHFGL